MMFLEKYLVSDLELSFPPFLCVCVCLEVSIREVTGCSSGFRNIRHMHCTSLLSFVVGLDH